jgi:hypothetical protein
MSRHSARQYSTQAARVGSFFSIIHRLTLPKNPRYVMPAPKRLTPLLLSLLLVPGLAEASFLAGEALDTMAEVISWFVLICMPIGGIYLFWMVHILPEKIAEKNGHPQKEAIHMLCMLSLVFGGLLWPFAFLWAKTRPVLHKMAYGTDRIEKELADDGARIAKLEAELASLKAARTDGGKA